MAETPRGIIYPASNAHTRLWEHFEALASSADDAVSAGVAESRLADSGWTLIPYSSGWKTSGTNNLAVRKIGKIVYARGQVTNTAGSIPPSNGANIGTLPAGFTPRGASAVFLIAPQNPASMQARIFFNTSGSIMLYTYGTNAPYVSVEGSFVAVD